MRLNQAKKPVDELAVEATEAELGSRPGDPIKVAMIIFATGIGILFIMTLMGGSGGFEDKLGLAILILSALGYGFQWHNGNQWTKYWAKHYSELSKSS